MSRKIKSLFIILILLILSCPLYYAVGYVPAKIKITEIEHKSINYPADFPVLRIVAISDLYAGSFHINEQKLEELVSHINLLKPDIVFLLGNYINSWSILGHYINPNKISEILTRIKTTYGSFAVFGKDDIFRGENVSELAFKRNNIKSLSDELINIDFGGKKIMSVLGIDSTRDIGETLEIKESLKTSEEKHIPYFIIANNSKYITTLPEDIKSKAVLALAGNTRGGQINFSGIRKLFLSEPTAEIYGKYKIGRSSSLYVSSGIGTKIYPIRINTEPEIVLINIYSANINDYNK